MKTKYKFLIIIALTSVILVSAIGGTLLYLISPKDDHFSFVKHVIEYDFRSVTYITHAAPSL